MKVTLTLNEKQAGVVQEALDMYFRVGMGQLREVADHIVPNGKGRPISSEWCQRRDDFYEAIVAARQFAMPELDRGAYYSIHHEAIHESNRVAVDIHDVLRGALAWHRKPEGGWEVCFDRVRHLSPEPLPTCTVEE